MPFRSEYVETLKLLARAFEGVTARGFESPVLVGGAVVEFNTESDVTSGDFDVVTPYQDALKEELVRVGFDLPSRFEPCQRGLIHKGLGIGVEVVGRVPFEGASDQSRLVVVDVGGGEVTMIPPEDIIADRLGQYCMDKISAVEMLEQARYVWILAEIDDEEYLDKRIQEETSGEMSLASAKRQFDHEAGHADRARKKD
ncbi:hypothetical protein [Magnetospira sp. QH-2]|uniref:hypothetical protein n=1 Tax=Magnetospira sp. (strain QH-2) TaxID=1288970 RepID=UPI0003E818EF|nr:hypothetical protein [Magnetospira sp. QH-2]CCQ72408.1 conserved protein of unknown function [Magnetospira sp. QH-2]